MRKRNLISLFIVLTGGCLFCLAGVLVYQLPPIQERLAWRVENLAGQVRRMINPPEQVVFVPLSTSQAGAGQALTETVPSATPVEIIALTATTNLTTDAPTVAPTLTPIPTATSTPIPPVVLLAGVMHEYQQFNNCGPANLAMALSYWGWQGDQRDTRSFLRPNLEVDDKNVNPAEMVAYVHGFTGMQAVARVGGNLDLLRELLAGGFPVLVEAGHHPPEDWWMGHYLVVNGYDDGAQTFTVQDSLQNPDLSMSYEELAGHWWRDFNRVYIVIYPPERQQQVNQILGLRLDEAHSYQLAAQQAIEEIPNLAGRDQFFAWFNLGSSRVGLQDYSGAAQAYDQAFELYAGLSEEVRPYRLMWYVDGPYRAYYETGRYQDVVNLANTTFSWVGKAVLEESYYWRGMAYLALGQQKNAISDFQKAVGLNPNYALPREQLASLNVALP